MKDFLLEHADKDPVSFHMPGHKGADIFRKYGYGEFLDRYLEIVPEYSFGLGKNDLLPDKELKKFLGY